MKTPCIRRSQDSRSERGVTMILVAVAMVAIISMAALSIDVITLYLAKQEAQRSADAAALAAAKILSVSSITGDPHNGTLNWAAICGPDDGTNGLATRVAKAVANQNLIGGAPATTPTVTYSSSGTSSSDCTALGATAFGVNPMVTVQLNRANLPTFFSRIWGNRGNSISATATAELFNPSNSANSGNNANGTPIPVQPRCVKPWVVPNQNPLIPAPISGPTGLSYCNQGAGPCNQIVGNAAGDIQNPGISVGSTANGIIGETFWLVADCRHNGSTCTVRRAGGPAANYGSASPFIKPMPNLLYLPGQTTTAPVGVPSCTTGDDFERAIEGCDSPANYSCGLPPASGGNNAVDLTENPWRPTSDGVACLIHQADNANVNASTGQDSLNPFMASPVSTYPVIAPSAYPFQILAGSGSSMVTAGLTAGAPISVSPSIVSLPIFDEAPLAPGPASGVTTPVTFVGFLQVFINAVDNGGNINVTVLNVAGCGNGSNPMGTAVNGSSPLPVRLITPP